MLLLILLAQLLIVVSTADSKMFESASFSAASLVDSLPCCANRIGEPACSMLKLTYGDKSFQNRCENDADFRLIQCCAACDVGNGRETYRQAAQRFFERKDGSRLCFDRMGVAFCHRFAHGFDVWRPKHYSCAARDVQLNFRICRKTCGYCRLDWMNAPNDDECLSNSGEYVKSEQMYKQLFTW